MRKSISVEEDRKYQKIKLKSSSIKRYKAKFKLKCDNKKAVYYFQSSDDSKAGQRKDITVFIRIA